MKKISKTEAEKEIKDFFKEIQNKTPKEIKKIKKLAMRYNIKLGELRKKFCKKCYSTRLKILGIKNKTKRIICKSCGSIGGYRLK